MYPLFEINPNELQKRRNRISMNDQVLYYDSVTLAVLPDTIVAFDTTGKRAFRYLATFSEKWCFW